MAKEIMFYNGHTYEYPETLTTPAGIPTVKLFLKRVFKVLSGFRHLGYPEIIEVGFDFDNYVIFVNGSQGFYACYQLAKDSYPFFTDTARHFVLQIVLPQLISLSKL